MGFGLSSELIDAWTLVEEDAFLFSRKSGVTRPFSRVRCPAGAWRRRDGSGQWLAGGPDVSGALSAR